MSSQSSLYVSQWWRFPLINISMWKRSSLGEHHFGRKMSPAWLNSLSTPAEDGTGGVEFYEQVNERWLTLKVTVFQLN